MSLKYTLGYAFCIGALVLGTPLELRSNSDLANVNIYVDPPPDPLALTLDPTSASNKSVPSLNGTSDKDIHIQCHGASYGFDLDILDCEQAKAYVPASAEQVQWAERHTGWQKKIFPLPYRAMGNKASCYVQTILIDGAPFAKANLNQVRNAAATIRHECYSSGKLQGGIATNIGE